MKKLKEKRGDGYIFPCVIILVICIMLSVFIFFAGAVNMVRITKENSKIVLDSYVMKNSIGIYNSIKQGNDYTEVLDQNVYIDELCEFCTLAKDNYYLYSYDNDGKLKYMMTRPTIIFREEKTLKIELRYTLYVPVWFNGKVVQYAVIPIFINSSFTEKF